MFFLAHSKSLPYINYPISGKRLKDALSTEDQFGYFGRGKVKICTFSPESWSKMYIFLATRVVLYQRLAFHSTLGYIKSNLLWSEMQTIKYLSHWLEENANSEHYLFSLQDFRALFPSLSDSAFKTLLSRAVQSGHLERVCRGLYLYKRAMPRDGLLLFHAAAYLRANAFNYISLETALSDRGIISQIPINWITLMSTGRSNSISCGKYGTIEFIHTNKEPLEVMDQLTYDANCKLWRASVPLALQDMKRTHRNCDLIDWEVAHEFI